MTVVIADTSPFELLELCTSMVIGSRVKCLPTRCGLGKLMCGFRPRDSHERNRHNKKRPSTAGVAWPTLE